MDFDLIYRPIRKFHSGYAFHFPPTPSAVSALQVTSDVYALT
mgnify:CR=1 FL=1